MILMMLIYQKLVLIYCDKFQGTRSGGYSCLGGQAPNLVEVIGAFRCSLDRNQGAENGYSVGVRCDMFVDFYSGNGYHPGP